jgi:type III secretion protein Q
MTAPLVTMKTLAQALPRLSVEQARLQRLGFDARFERWLADCFGTQALAVVPASGVGCAGTRIDLSVPGGSVSVATDLAAWPAAQLLLQAQEAPLARVLGDALFAGIFGQLQQVLPELQVSGVTPLAATKPTVQAQVFPSIVTQGVVASLLTCDGNAHDALLDAAHSVVPHLDTLAKVRLVGRLLLLRRCLSVATLQTLRRGDVVLLGPDTAYSSSTHVLQFGAGKTMQARTDVDFSQQKVTVTAEPRLADEDAIAASSVESQALPESMAELMLPIAFEIETAALSLRELASMRPGYVIELAVPLMEATVRLVCHGQAIGTGQLVAIGGQLGVRIHRISHDAAAQR